MSKEVGKEGTHHVEDDVVGAPNGIHGAKPTFGQKLKRHCARFWWLHALIFIAVLLIILLPVIYVAYPNKAQSAVNKSALEVTSMSILNPTPDSFDILLDNTFLTNSSTKAHLDAFDADLLLEGSEIPYAQLRIPAAKSSNGTNIHIDQKVEIHNMDQFDDYTKATLLSEEFTIYLKGRGKLQVGKLPKTTVKYNKKITMKGLNSLKGFALTEFAIVTTPQADGSNANGTVLIPNPSVATYEMGNLTMDMSVAGIPVGVTTLENVTLRPGNNTFPMRAVTNQTTVVGLLFTDYKSGILPIDIVSNQTVFNGKEIGFYARALQNNKLTVQLDLIKALQEAGLAEALGIGNSTSEA